jgi:hypothetical protein
MISSDVGVATFLRLMRLKIGPRSESRNRKGIHDGNKCDESLRILYNISEISGWVQRYMIGD